MSWASNCSGTLFNLGVKSSAFLFVFIASTAQAFAPLSDSEMASVRGQDGLLVTHDDGANGIDIGRIEWINDGSISLETINYDVASSTGDSRLEVDADFSAGLGRLRVEASWDAALLEIGGIYTYTNAATPVKSTYSGGSIGFYSSGGITLENTGLFNSTSTNAYLKIEFSESETGDFILRQGAAGSPELSFGNANLKLETTNCATTSDCTIGISATDGMFVNADTIDLDLNFDLLYKETPTDFDRTGRSDMIKLGWAGGLSNFSTSIGSAGIIGSGLNIDVEFDYQTDFKFILGQAGANNTRAEFKNFQALGVQVDPIFSMPINIDTIPAGSTLETVCFGAAVACTPSSTVEAVPLVVDAQALGVYIRNGRLKGYNTQVDVVDVGAGTTNTYNWSLGYTFGRLDANIMLYPGLDADYNNTFDSDGITADIVLAANSPGFWTAAQSTSGSAAILSADWQNNTHFFIADTNTALDVTGDGTPGDRFGFGLFNSDFVWKADNLGIRITGEEANFNGNTGFTVPGGLWLQSVDGTTAGNVRYQFRGVLGGGDLNNLSNIAPISLVDIRLDTDDFLFALSPANTVPASIGYTGLLEFNTDTYISLAEPSQPTADMRFEQIEGRVIWEDGSIQITSANDNPVTGQPALTLENDILIGDSAYGGAGLSTDVYLGANRLGQIKIPSATFYSKLSLSPK